MHIRIVVALFCPECSESTGNELAVPSSQKQASCTVLSAVASRFNAHISNVTWHSQRWIPRPETDIDETATCGCGPDHDSKGQGSNIAHIECETADRCSCGWRGADAWRTAVWPQLREASAAEGVTWLPPGCGF